MTVVQVSDYWQARCECGWSSRAMRFPDPDAAYHCGTLHDAVAHPERIDWKAEAAKMRGAGDDA